MSGGMKWETCSAAELKSTQYRWKHDYWNHRQKMDMRWTGHVDSPVKVVIYCLQQTAQGDRLEGECRGRFLCRTFKKKEKDCDKLKMAASTFRQTLKTWDMHMNWHPGVCGAECWDGVYLCGLPSERPRWVIPRAVLPHSKHMTMGWLSKPLSSICLIWAFCLHLSSAPRLKAVALLLFASLLGSEENDNNEAWRLSTASHTNIHIYTANTDAAANAGTHTYTHTPTHSAL